MKPFQFRLESVLQLKSRLLEMEEATLQRLLQAEHSLEAQIQEVFSDSKRQAHFLEAEEYVTGIILSTYSAYQEHCKARITGLSSALDACRRAQETQRNRILELRRERELLERLKTKQFREWLYLSNKEIEDFASEAFLNRVAREASDKGSKKRAANSAL